MNRDRVVSVGWRAAAWLLVVASVSSVPAVPSFAVFDDIGIGPRPSGMGNAFVAIADDSHAIYYNPAGLGSLISSEFSTSYAKLFLGLSDGSSIGQSSLAYAQPIKRGQYGAVGIGWNQLELSGLYREQTIYLSYGKLVAKDLGGGQLLLGGSLKQLSRSLTVPSNPDGSTIFTNPVQNNGLQDGSTGTDPNLQKPSNTAMDADLGILYAFRKRYSLGMEIVHLMSPNVGFKSSDKLAMGEKIGFAYRGPLTRLTLELQREEGAVPGVVSQVFVLGGERWIKTEHAGEFAVRTGFGTGDAGFSQWSFGLSYRFAKLEIDYAFTLPLGGITGTTGHQRFGLSFRFGATEAAEKTAGERMIEDVKGLGGLEPTSYEEKVEQSKERQEAQKLYAKAQGLIQEGQFSKASASMTEAIKRDPTIPGVGEYFRRLNFVAESLPELADVTTKSHSFVFNGILDFLAQKDDDAMRKVAYGFSLNAKDKDVEDFLVKLEKFTGIKAEKVEGETPMSLVDQKLTESLMAFRDRKYDRVISLCEEVLGLEPDNLVALKRLGSALYVTKAYDKAAEVLQKAYTLETNEKEKATIKKFLGLAEEKMKTQAPLTPGATEQAPAPAPATP